MEHFEALGLEGGLIRICGEVVAFTMGDRLNSTIYDVHFEKAYNELRGPIPSSTGSLPAGPGEVP